MWNYPEGQRSAKVREWVDTALRLTDILDDIRKEIKSLKFGAGPGGSVKKVNSSDGMGEFLMALEK